MVAGRPGPLYCLDFKNLNDLKEVADAQIEKCSLVTDFDVLCPTTVLQETQDRCRPDRLWRATQSLVGRIGNGISERTARVSERKKNNYKGGAGGGGGG